VTDDQIIFSPAPGSPELAAATLTIDLKVLQDNWRQLAREAAPATCAATVKGDAYGLGIEPVCRALAAAGCKIFFVALPHEGAAVRRILPDSTVYIMDGLLPGSAAYYAEHKLTPCLASLEEIEDWRTYCAEASTTLACCLHVNTGINRLGLSETDVEVLASPGSGADELDSRLIMTHLANGDQPGHPRNEEQLETFNRLRAMLPDAPASIANSPGCFLGAGFSLDLVRPGIALFGGNPFSTRPNPMSPVAHLYAPILQVRDIETGQSVGYGESWTAARPSKIAVFGLGYRDGYLRALSYPANDGPAHVMIGGHYAPVVGRISMDTINVDITDIPPDFARRGINAEIMGDHVTVDDIARWANTIPYEILTLLGTRYARLYSAFDSG
jgi:alanine racemase